MTYIPSTIAAPTDLELRAGIESLEYLHAERREIIKKLSPLALLYGSGGDRAEAKRKQHRAVIGKLIREETPDGRDLPQNRVEAMANSDPRHIAYCDELDKQFIEYRHWETALDEIEERIDSRSAELRFVTAEARLSGAAQ